MERLTYDFVALGVHCWQIYGADNELCGDVCKRYSEAGCKNCPIGHAFDRLAAYEDTGLEPEEVARLARAEQDGRLVELPCYTGDKVYMSLLGKILELKVGSIVLNGSVTTIYYYSSSIRSCPEDFGKTVFLTREEAEAALKGEKNA